jgi:general secretion pathway protein A
VTVTFSRKRPDADVGERKMDYIEYFGLKEDPFKIAPDLTYFYPTKGHNEVLRALNYAVTQREGFCLATGEPGTGKTMLLTMFVEEWRNKAEISLVLAPRVSPEELLLGIVEDLGIPLTGRSKNETMKSIRDFLASMASLGKTVIIVIDEAQDLPEESLEELRLLSNMESGKEKLLEIVLMGQQELKERLSTERLKPLSQRMTVKATLGPLTREETFDYINFRTMKAGTGLPGFDENAKALIYRYSNGIPRVINVIASRSLMAAYMDGSLHVRKVHVRTAISHLSGREEDFAKRTRLVRYGVAVVLIAALCAAGIFGYRHYLAGPTVQEAPPPSQETKEAKEAPPPSQVIPKAQEVPPPSQEAAKGQETVTRPEAKPAPVSSQGGRAVVTAHSAILRQEPSFDAEPVSYASQGIVLKVIQRQAGADGITWYKVRISDGRLCWISSKVVQITK